MHNNSSQASKSIIQEPAISSPDISADRTRSPPPDHFRHSKSVAVQKASELSCSRRRNPSLAAPMPPSLTPAVSPFRNALATHKTHLPLPPVPALAQVKRYPINSYSKSLFAKTKYEPFAGTFDPLTGSVKNLRAGMFLSVFGVDWAWRRWTECLSVDGADCRVFGET